MQRATNARRPRTSPHTPDSRPTSPGPLTMPTHPFHSAIAPRTPPDNPACPTALIQTGTPLAFADNRPCHARGVAPRPLRVCGRHVTGRRYVARMADASALAVLVAVLSLLIAASSLMWSISSWRRSGPLLRVHALLYEQELVIRVFNAGRAPDSIDQVAIGGSRRGRGGIDITAALGAPATLRPGESRCWRLEWREQIPQSRQVLLVQGWESLWLLRGSMTEQRTEVLSQPGRVPPTSGWDLAKASSDRDRYVPLIMAVPLGALAVDATSHFLQAWIFIGITSLVLLHRVVRWVSRTGAVAARRRAEHAAVVIGSVVVLFAWEARLDASTPITIYILVATLLAWPGAVSGLIAGVQRFASGTRSRLSHVGGASDT